MATYPIVRMVIDSESIEFLNVDVIEAQSLQETHPISLELPASTVSIRIHTIDTRFNPFSSGSFYQSLVVGLIVDVYEKLDSSASELFVGRFYLQEWKNPSEGTFEFVCTDAIGILHNKNYLGSFFETATPVSEIVAGLLEPVSIDYAIDAEVGAKKLKGYLPGNKTIRESLQQVLFAASAYATTAGSSVINIHEFVTPNAGAVEYLHVYTVSPVPDSCVNGLYGTAYYSDQAAGMRVSDSQISQSQSLDILQLVTAVEISSHDYAKGLISEEIFSADLPEGDYLVVYPKPYHEVIATGVGDSIVYLATTNDEVLITPDSDGVFPDVTIFTVYGEFEFGVNHVFLHVPSGGGSAYVTGKPWVDSVQMHTYTHPNGASAPPNVWRITDAFLLPSIETAEELAEGLLVLAPDVLARVAEYSNLRYLQKIKLIPYTYYDEVLSENVTIYRTDVIPGDVSIVSSLYDKDIVGVTRKIEMNLTGGFLIDAELVGVERTSNG